MLNPWPAGSTTPWRILDTDFGTGQHFLTAWQSWKTSPAATRPRLLHYCAITAQPLDAAELLKLNALTPELTALAETLVAQWHGLQPGFHRINLDGGHVLLTLCVGELKAVLRELAFTADSVVLAGCNESWNIHTAKAIARCCQRGTYIASDDLATSVAQLFTQCGTVWGTPASLSTHRYAPRWHGIYNPHWEPKNRHTESQPVPISTCLVVGAGLAGAAVANSLARRGWQVTVLDANAHPAQGASGIPAGLAVPHVSPDDSVLSRLSRSGVRITLQQAQAMLVAGVDWNQSGVLEHRVDGSPGLSPHAGLDTEWSRPASTAQLHVAQLASDAKAIWHGHAAWIKPAALVTALLNHPNITWQGDSQVSSLHSLPGMAADAGQWQLRDAVGRPLAQAQLVVVAAAFASQHLIATLPLQAIRGQISWGMHPLSPEKTPPASTALPPFPVNGHGSLIPWIPMAEGVAWAAGATFERDQADMSSSAETTAQHHADNQIRLQKLLPRVATQHAVSSSESQAFVGIRCVSPDRLPLVGPVAAAPSTTGLWLSTAMGSRGLSFALLCAELLAARLHGEPWPVEKRLGHALDARRFPSSAKASP